ncbi:MAG: 50S ribosomal protein L32 [Gammaproteobacteria bacterium]
MAVQKSRRSRSTRGQRRVHDKLTSLPVSMDQETGELHLRHHITANGYYKGKQIISKQVSNMENSDENTHE